MVSPRGGTGAGAARRRLDIDPRAARFSFPYLNRDLGWMSYVLTV